MPRLQVSLFTHKAKLCEKGVLEGHPSRIITHKGNLLLKLLGFILGEMSLERVYFDPQIFVSFVKGVL